VGVAVGLDALLVLGEALGRGEAGHADVEAGLGGVVVGVGLAKARLLQYGAVQFDHVYGMAMRSLDHALSLCLGGRLAGA